MKISANEPIEHRLKWLIGKYPKIAIPQSNSDIFQNEVNDILANSLDKMTYQNELIELMQARLKRYE